MCTYCIELKCRITSLLTPYCEAISHIWETFKCKWMWVVCQWLKTLFQATASVIRNHPVSWKNTIFSIYPQAKRIYVFMLELWQLICKIWSILVFFLWVTPGKRYKWEVWKKEWHKLNIWNLRWTHAHWQMRPWQNEGALLKPLPPHYLARFWETLSKR